MELQPANAPTPISPQSQGFSSNSTPPTIPADLSMAENPQNTTGDITMTPVGETAPTSITAPQPSPKISLPTPQQPAVQPPLKKGDRGIGIIRAIASALGGGPQNELDPNTGEPTVRTGTGALIARAIGRFGGSVAAGLANSQGPSGASRAALSAFNKQQQFSEEDQKRRYKTMEMFRAQALQLASLRHQGLEDESRSLGNTKLQQELYDNNKDWMESHLSSGAVMANESGVPFGENEALEKYQDLVKEGYKPGSIMTYLGPPRPSVKDPTKTEQTYFLLTPPVPDAELPSIVPNDAARDQLSKSLGVNVEKGQTIPPHVINSLLAGKTAVSTSIEKAQQELNAAGIKDVPRAQVDLGNLRQAMIATQAMKNWQMIHSPYGDVAKDLDAFEKRFPGPGRAWISEHLYGGKEKDVSAYFATKNMTADQKIKFEKDQTELEKSKVDLQKAQNEAAAAPAKNAEEAEKRKYEIEALKLKVANDQATADGKKPVPDPNGKSGEEYIAMLPAEMQQTVRDLGTGQMALSRYDYIIAKNPQLIYAAANAYPDTFNTAKASAFPEEQKRFQGGGDVGKLINSIGAMAEHARTAYDLATKHPIMSAGGQLTEAGTDYKGAVGALSEEVAAFLKGGGAPTDVEQKFWNQYLNPTLFYERPAAIREVVNRLIGKYNEFNSQWEKALPNPKMFAKNPMPGVSDQALQNMKYVINRGQLTIDVRMPNGHIAHFDSQEKADVFKKAARIE